MIEKPKLIKGWEDLAALPPSKTHFLEINLESGNGWIREKEAKPGKPGIYLSTHTFYGSTFARATKRLQECGFNVQLDNWDTKSSMPTPRTDAVMAALGSNERGEIPFSGIRSLLQLCEELERELASIATKECDCPKCSGWGEVVELGFVVECPTCKGAKVVKVILNAQSDSKTKSCS